MYLQGLCVWRPLNGRLWPHMAVSLQASVCEYGLRLRQHYISAKPLRLPLAEF